jgi:hypothetical protein
MAGDRPAATVGHTVALRRAPAAGTLALLALVWLLAMLTAARLTIGDAPDAGGLSVTLAALELPRVVAASLVAGVAAALSVLDLLARRAGVAPAGRAEAVLQRMPLRLGTATGTGLALGLAVAVPVATGYAGLPHVLVLAGAIALAAMLGGVVAALPQRVLVAAGVAGVLGAFLVGFAAGRLDTDLRTLFGAGQSPQSVLAASGWVVLAASLAAGLVAGGLGYAYLSRAGRPLPWPAYLAAGALPGLLLLLAEVVARVGAFPLVRLITRTSPPDRTVWDYLAAVRVNQGLIVLFAGAVAAILLFGHRRAGRAPSGQ